MATNEASPGDNPERSADNDQNRLPPPMRGSVLTCLAFISFAFAVGIPIVAAFFRNVIRDDISRMGAILVVCVCLSILEWAMFPHLVRVAKFTIPVIGWQVTGLAGPFVLFAVAFGLLHHYFPYPSPSTRYYEFTTSADLIPSFHSFRFDGKATDGRLLPVMSPSSPNTMVGLLAKFDGADSFEIELSSEPSYFKTKKEKFDPGMRTKEIRLTKNE